ncbi:period circadian protein homolog 2 isoform X1 [Ochotona princeps]|uniref:period circadian protein homolog 2 isoform X1 n=1 Tax=Ochotona princeps TaxID=9978 RepID=UPI002714AE73|nr:period circadian protein homolog 2 isoform X1 [Ochotona princeps]
MSSGCSGNAAHENCSVGQGSRGSGKELGTLLQEPDTCQGPTAFSLAMAESEHNPYSSGCSSEQSAKADTYQELIRTLKELKVHLPTDRKAKGRASTLATLKYALRSVKQVKASEEYYQLLMSSGSQPCGLDVASYSMAEVESITSEFIGKNGDMFTVAVSLVTGKVLYISSQVASLFHCKRDTFHDAKFVEFLAPHDVSVFHSSTTPYKLPAWSTCSLGDAFTQECTAVKSFFCRVSVGKNHENEIRYHAFRMTPYLAKVQEQPGAESQLSCLLLAERVHSGYEAPRIPPEKRIFTTTHTPNCLFQDVDERAVPLLGYLPQDLLETPVLLQLHPSDRPLMLTIHKKIVQAGGQPFDSSPIRFRARNGEYITLDSSWSSFINPWSRRISFIIGRHKVRVGPSNEDVFAAHTCAEEKAPHPGIQELTEEIHRLLLQPVPHSGSSGYGSLGSNGSQEQPLSHTSSSDSNGHEDSGHRRSDVPKSDKTKTRSPHSHESVPDLQRSRLAQMKAAPATKKDSSGDSSSKADFLEELACKPLPSCSYQQMSCLDSVIRYLESCTEAATLKRKCEFPANIPSRKSASSPGLPLEEAAVPAKVSSHVEVSAHLSSLTLPSKAESVVSLTSQCSYSSTIVHVGDKKPQPELEPVEDAMGGPESLDLPCGLTKEVLAAHTQKEEQSFLHKFRGVGRLAIFPSHWRLCPRSSEPAPPGLRNVSGMDSSWKKTGKNRKLKSKRVKPRDSSDSTVSGGPVPQHPPLTGLSATAWSPLATSQSSCPAVPFPAPMPAYSLPVFPAPGMVAAMPVAPSAGFVMPGQPELAVQASLFPAPLAPVVDFMLPSSYPFSPGPLSPPQAFPSQPGFEASLTSASPPEVPSQSSLPRPPSAFCPASGTRRSTSPPLFQSRGSSPLQLNLLQLEEAPEGSVGAAGTSGTAGTGPDYKPGTVPDRLPKASSASEEPADKHNSDALSTSSDLLNLLLNDHLGSATGSARSGSSASATSDFLGSGATRSGTDSSDTSHLSRCLGSTAPSENSHKAVRAPALEGSVDPVRLLMADTDDRAMLTYQLPSRDMETVLKEDREKLQLLHKSQPRLSEGQWQELREVHPWVQMGSLPAALDVAECVYCEDGDQGGLCAPYKEDDSDSLGLSEGPDAKEEGRPTLTQAQAGHP